MSGDGTLGVVIWPTYAGAVRADGVEPLFDIGYDRGQIGWGVNEQDRIVGHAVITVPAGTWTHVVYTHHPLQPRIIHVQKLAHPFRLDAPGTISLIDITDDDVRPLAPDKVLHD
jgi:hypothetical protein